MSREDTILAKRVMMTGRANDKVLGEWKVRMRRTLNAILKELIQLAVQPIKGFLVRNNRYGMITLEIKMWSRRHLYSSCPSISPPPAKKNISAVFPHTPLENHFSNIKREIGKVCLP